MKNIYDLLKFKLDSECADYEFEIIPIPPYEMLVNNLSLEPYEYFGKDDKIMGKKTKQIILYYNCDILMKVIISFTGEILDELISEISSSGLGLPGNINLKLWYDQERNMTIIEYQKKILGKL